MMNVWCGMGRLVADPELKHTNAGIPVTSFTIAVYRAHTKGGERTTDFISIVAWRQTAEFLYKYFRKGQLIGINGSLQVREYIDRDNNKRKAYEIVADNVHFADSKRDGGNQRDSGFRDGLNDPPQTFAENGDPGDDLPF